MRWKRVLAALVALPIAAQFASAQVATGRIAGTVSERETGRPVSDVTIQIVGTHAGTRSGANGQYAVANVEPGTYVVRAARIGFAAATDTVTVTAGRTTTADFGLRQISVTLDQMVVVGYGTQKRSDLTGSVASVTPHVDQTPTTSLEQTLQGAAPGVQVTTASSAPGGGISIRIRGGSSITGNNEPLYVIDGFPVENDPTNSSPTSGGRDPNVTVPSDPLASLNPDDIASIEILKDASATSIYGARGANGVIIITTKRGSAGKPRLSIDTYTGMQSIAKRYDLLTPRQFVDFSNVWAKNNNPADTTTAFTNADSVAALGTDWQNDIFRTAPMSNLQMTLTGGTSGDNATRYAISGGVLQQQGIVQNSDFKRVSLRGNVDQAVGQKLHLTSNLLVSRVGTSQVPTDGSLNAGAGAVGAALQYIPILPVRQADGSYSLMSSNYPTALASRGLTGGNIPNPVASALDVQDVLGDTRVLANATGEYTLLSGLTFKTNVGADLSDRTRDTYYPRTTLQGQPLNGRAIRGSLANTNWLTEYTLNYTKSFGTAHYIQAVGGYTRQSNTSVRETMDNSQFVSDINGYNDIGSGTQVGGPTIGSGRTRWTLASYLGRVNYTLLDRYLFTVTGREDGSSRFGMNHRWGFFPSAAVGWRISEEPFMRRFTAIDQMKLRASYGVAGNPSILPYQSLTHLTSDGYSFGGNIGNAYVPSTLGNPDLGWESTKQADYGLDLAMWHELVDLTVDYYDKRTDNLLLAKALPTESGFSAAYVNAGAISNKGVEVGLTLQPIRASREGSFGWSTTLSYSRNRNKVLDLGGIDRLFATSINSDIKASGTLVQVGQPIGVFYGYKTAGIFRDSTQLLAWQAKTRMSSGGSPSLGSTVFVDVNGDSVIDANDRTIIGDPNPKWSGGWENTFAYRGFQLMTLVDGRYGGQIMNLNLYRAEGASPSTNVLKSRFYDAWSPTNPNGRYPAIGAGLGFLGSDFTDQLLEDGSFTRLRTVSLSRDIPANWFHGLLNGARFYVTGQNLHTWTRYQGFNPDVSSLGVGNTNRGVDVGAYPLARAWIFGLNLNY